MEQRIAIFGASGRTGRSVVTQAVQRGDEVVVLVRDASKQWFPDAVDVRQGQPSDPHDVEAALVGADAVVSALGPIAEETTTEISDATRAIVDAMERLGPRRIVIAANAKVLDDSEVTGAYANVTAEHRRDAAILRESRLDWTVVAAPMLTDDPATGAVVARRRRQGARPLDHARRLRRALLDAVGTDAWIGHVVGVSNPPAVR